MRIAILVLSLVVLPAWGTLYKLTDPQGHVTYSNERPPAGFRGEVTVVDVDTVNTVVPSTPATAPQRVERGAPRVVKVDPVKSELAAARAKAALARQAFETVRDNPGAGDWIAHPSLPSGASRGPSPEYAERLTRLEQAAIEAEKRVAELERR